MTWIQTVLLTHAFSATLTATLLVSVLREPRKTIVHWSFVGVLGGSLAWLVVNAVSEWLTMRGTPDDFVGSLAGIAVQTMTVASFVLCEALPYRAGRSTGRAPESAGLSRRSLLRIAAISVVSVSIAALSFSPQYISNRRVLGTSTTAEYGLYFQLAALWASVAVSWGLILLYGKYARETDTRLRLQMWLYLIGVALSLGLALLFAFFLPLLGNSRLFFLGVDSSIVLTTVMTYAILFFRLFDLRTALLRLLLRAVLGAALALAIYLVFLVLILDRNISDFSWELALVLWAFFVTVLVFAQRVLPWIDRWLFARPARLEEFVTQLLRATDDADLPSGDLRDILRTLHRALPARTGLLFVLEADARRPALRLHRHQTDFRFTAAQGRALRRLLFVQRWPARFAALLDQVLVLDAGPEFDSRRYPWTTRVLDEALASLAAAGFRVVLPLIHAQRLAGFIALGEKKDDLPYFERDIDFLEGARLSIAILLQHQALLQTERLYRDEASADLEKLAVELSGERLSRQSPQIGERAELRDRALVYRSEIMRTVLEQVENVSSSPHPVLITGPTGTGKELIARLIHERSDRRDLPFVAVNCAAIAENLWEDELFGHAKGAFTDARADRAGRVREAGAGTLFLDEIGEMPLEMQAKLLRLLQEGAYSPVGSDAAFQARCRFLFATNRSLPETIGQGAFREDLYYRINVFEIYLPPLRERPEDIPELLRHFMEKTNRELGYPLHTIEHAAESILLRYPWPGNVRELENFVVRAAALSRRDVLRVADLPASMRGRTGGNPKLLVTEHAISDSDRTLRELVDDYTKKILLETLKKTGGNRTRAAQMLGVKRGALLYRMKELGVE